MKCKVSVIVPAYNVEKYISRCIESILNSTYQDVEVIVIDDGSTDKTWECIEKYQKDPRVITVHQRNKGLVEVREEGILMATGDYVGFVDGDDAVEPDMYERLLRNALKEDADISHCGLCVYWPDSRKEPHYGTGRMYTQSGMEALKDLLDGVLFDASLCNKLYRREILKNSCLDRSIQSNEDLLRNFILFGRAQKVVFEDFCGYQYWSRENSMSNDSKVIQRYQQVIAARRIILQNAENDIVSHAKRLLLSTYVGVINQNYRNNDPKLRALCCECRNELIKEKDNISLLIRRQQIAAYLIIYAPWLHRAVYSIYASRR